MNDTKETKPLLECPRCGSDEWSYCNYGGCSECRSHEDRATETQEDAVDSIKVGPLTFRFEPDGDDSGTGWIAIESDYEGTKIQASRTDWEWFKDMIR